MPAWTATRFDVNEQMPLPQALTDCGAFSILGDDGLPTLTCRHIQRFRAFEARGADAGKGIDVGCSSLAATISRYSSKRHTYAPKPGALP